MPLRPAPVCIPGVMQPSPDPLLTCVSRGTLRQVGTDGRGRRVYQCGVCFSLHKEDEL